MTTVLYYEMRQKQLNCLEQLRYLRAVATEPDWDMNGAGAIPEENFANAMYLVETIGFERVPEISVSANGNLGLLFLSEIFRGIAAKVVTVVVVFREGKIKVSTLFADDTEQSSGFVECRKDEIVKTAEYINGIK